MRCHLSQSKFEKVVRRKVLQVPIQGSKSSAYRRACKIASYFFPMTEEIEENVKIKVHFQGKTYEIPAKKINFLELLEKQKPNK